MVIDATTRFTDKAAAHRSSVARQKLHALVERNPQLAAGLAAIVRQELETRHDKRT
jgi:hypothetical protein